MTTGAFLIAAERQRQITREGWTPEHDDSHDGGELVAAAVAYAQEAQNRMAEGDIWPRHTKEHPPGLWPFNDGWNPSDDPIRNLTKAGALIAAEIDRLCRTDGQLFDALRRHAVRVRPQTGREGRS